MKSTNPNGTLTEILDCYLIVPNYQKDNGKIIMNNLPDISDTKQASYNEEPIMGRSSPLHTFSSSGSRQLSITFHFFITSKKGKGSASQNIDELRAIQSCLYTRPGIGNIVFLPPVICKFKCGRILGDEELCLILTNYSISLPTEVPWDVETLCPYKFDLSTSWTVVYTSEQLPYANRIITSGR